MKTASLIRYEQAANFEHLINLIQSASSYKMLKSIWYEVRKIEKEVRDELGADCWILSYKQNRELVAIYNDHKFSRFGVEVDSEMRALDKRVLELEEEIFKAKNKGDLRQINVKIYRDVKNADAKEHLRDISAKAYRELAS